MSSRGKAFFIKWIPLLPCSVHTSCYFLIHWGLLLIYLSQLVLKTTRFFKSWPPLDPSVAFSVLVGDLHLENQSMSFLEEAGRVRLKFGWISQTILNISRILVFLSKFSPQNQHVIGLFSIYFQRIPEKVGRLLIDEPTKFCIENPKSNTNTKKSRGITSANIFHPPKIAWTSLK